LQQTAFAPAASILAVMAIAAIAAVGGQLAAIGAMYAAAYGRASRRFAEQDQQPQLLTTRTPAQFRKRLRKDAGLAPAAWAAGAALLAAVVILFIAQR
jgi:hypothetical protein